MARFIVRFAGVGEKPRADVELIRSQPGLTVLDESSRMLLVDMPEGAAQALEKSLPEWKVSREQMVPLPDTRPKPR